MATQIPFENFLADIDPGFEEMVLNLHEMMGQAGCKVKLQQAKSGHVVSYLDPNTNKTVLNLVARRKGPQARIYADHIAGYEEQLAALPQEMKVLIQKAGVCKRLIDPAKCNSRCPMGYTFRLDGETLQRCRYGLMFPVDAGTVEGIQGMLRAELAQRTA